MDLDDILKQHARAITPMVVAKTGYSQGYVYQSLLGTYKINENRQLIIKVAKEMLIELLTEQLATLKGRNDEK